MGVAVVESKLSSQASDHEIKISEGWDTGLHAGGLVEEGGVWGEEEVLVCVGVCGCVWVCVGGGGEK